MAEWSGECEEEDPNEEEEEKEYEALEDNPFPNRVTQYPDHWQQLEGWWPHNVEATGALREVALQAGDEQEGAYEELEEEYLEEADEEKSVGDDAACPVGLSSSGAASHEASGGEGISDRGDFEEGGDGETVEEEEGDYEAEEECSVESDW